MGFTFVVGTLSVNSGQDMVQQIFVLSDEFPTGPYSAKQIREMASNGALLPDSLISFDQQNWGEASKLKGLMFPESTKTTARPEAPQVAKRIGKLQISNRHSARISANTEVVKQEANVVQGPKSPLLSWMFGVCKSWLLFLNGICFFFFVIFAILGLLKEPIAKGESFGFQVFATLLAAMFIGTGLWVLCLITYLYLTLCNAKQSRCPNCRRWFAGEEMESSNYVIGQVDVSIPTQRAIRSTPFGAPIGYIDDQTTVRHDVTLRHWECRYCEHCWRTTDVGV